VSNNNKKNNVIISYEEIKLIGAGGFGRALLALDTGLNREIVVKEIPVFLLPPKDYFREAKLLHESSHIGVVEAYYAGMKIEKYQSKGSNDPYKDYHDKEIEYLCLAMKYYKNGDLEDKIGSLTIVESVKYMLDILQALHHIHSKKLIHKDLKTNNILITDNNRAVIADFGLSRKLNDNESVILTAEDGGCIPTRPPESFVKTYPANNLTDIYQVGIIFFLMLSNIKLETFIRKVYSDLGNNDIAFVKALNDGNVYDTNILKDKIPKELIKITKKLIEKDPKKRYQDCISIINDLCSIESI